MDKITHICVSTTSINPLKPVVFGTHAGGIQRNIRLFRQLCSLERWNSASRYAITTVEGREIWWRESNPAKARIFKQQSKAYAFRERVKQCTDKDGKVAMVRSGMDCDCATFCDATRIDANPQAIEAWIDEDQSWADGPVSYSLITPDEYREFNPPRSRDLALEAFEDGHPHTVSEARYETN